MKKYIVGFVGTIVGAGMLSSGVSYAQGDECVSRFFEVTAYYSPLPDQVHYRHGDYESEKKMNGEGIVGASGKEVFDGMIAAPQGYEFGDTIYLDGYGRGQVEDRGGAIVAGADNDQTGLDRIDIRAGHGEEGLLRALTIGRKTIQGLYCAGGSDETDALYDIGFSFPDDNFLKHFFKISLYDRTLRMGDKNVWVYELNNYLSLLGYDVSVGPSYDAKTRDAMCLFQSQQGIYDQDNDQCGVFDPATQDVLKSEVIAKKVAPSQIWARTSFDEVKGYIDAVMAGQSPAGESSSGGSQPQRRYDFSAYDRTFTRAYTVGETTNDILYLHIKLTLLGYYTGPINQTYSSETVQAIYDFQVDHDILVAYEDRPEIRGRFGPATRRALNSYTINGIMATILGY